MKNNDFLHLHVDNNNLVWCDTGHTTPVNSQLNALEFADKFAIPANTIVRLRGNKRNAALIVRLTLLKEKGLLRSVKVCKPDLVTVNPTPEHALRFLRLMNLPTSLGGWHEVDKVDLLSYALASVKQEDFANTNLYKQCWSHPVGVVTSFCGDKTLDSALAVQAIVRDILDPRWFISTVNPNSHNTLESYLGVTPNTIKRISVNGTDPDNPKQHLSRVANLCSCWAGSISVKSLYKEPPQISAFSTIYHKYLDQAVGALRASQKFVKLIQAVWLQAVTPHRELFVPEYFFDNQEDLEHWKQHAGDQFCLAPKIG